MPSSVLVAVGVELHRAHENRIKENAMREGVRGYRERAAPGERILQYFLHVCQCECV